MTPIISVEELAAALAGPNPPVLLDVRWKLGGPPGVVAYRAGHLPGAVFVDLDRDLAGPPGPGGRHPLPAPEAFQAAMRRCGVRDQADVVVYDEADSTAAARAWWLLRYFGHERVRVLDGGYRAWVAAGQPVETHEPQPAPGDFTARPGHLPVLDADDVPDFTRDGVLLDARAAERYRGEVEPVDPVAGHIPEAVSAPTLENVRPDGRFRDPAELRARFAALGVTPDTPVGAYCGSGVTAAHEVLALRLAGYEAALYPGSWSHWITDPNRPVAKGEE
ncbi:sulfurtransferase [Carbonactinospora thermoautotrophica]|uniref:sulfurtransferase n=1 Tax=Carbonactinospora thermoautotrophica TaxID=1469144 RepID=UPI0022700F75|nr:sulfurtransferase [Carbonactinospora thermoautotrophica]